MEPQVVPLLHVILTCLLFALVGVASVAIYYFFVVRDLRDTREHLFDTLETTQADLRTRQDELERSTDLVEQLTDKLNEANNALEAKPTREDVERTFHAVLEILYRADDRAVWKHNAETALNLALVTQALTKRASEGGPDVLHAATTLREAQARLRLANEEHRQAHQAYDLARVTLNRLLRDS